MPRPTRACLSQNTVTALRIWPGGPAAGGAAEALLPAARLLNNLTQVLRLCLDGPFDPGQGPGGPQGAAGAGRRSPRFPALEADLAAREAEVAHIFDFFFA